jgi:hypothetical protein
MSPALEQWMTSNRLVLAVLLATLVWLADQPTVKGYNPLAQMFWDPGLFHLPLWDLAVLFFSWVLTALFCHMLLFAWQRARRT